jgi:hypothetical protein
VSFGLARGSAMEEWVCGERLGFCGEKSDT